MYEQELRVRQQNRRALTEAYVLARSRLEDEVNEWINELLPRTEDLIGDRDVPDGTEIYVLLGSIGTQAYWEDEKGNEVFVNGLDAQEVLELRSYLENLGMLPYVYLLDIWETHD